MALGERSSMFVDVDPCDEAEERTDRAVLFRRNGDELWIPLTELGAVKRDSSGRIVRIEISTFIARQRGFKVAPKIEI